MLVSKCSDEIVYASDLVDVDTTGITFVCKYCETEVITKRGGCKNGVPNCKRPHFAHKDASECVLNSQSGAQLDLKQKLIDIYKRKRDIEVDAVIGSELLDIVIEPHKGVRRRTVIKIVNKKWDDRHAFESVCESAGIHNFIYILTKVYRTTPVFLMDLQYKNGYVYTYVEGKLYNYHYESPYYVGVRVVRSQCKNVTIGNGRFKNDKWNPKSKENEHFLFGRDGYEDEYCRGCDSPRNINRVH